MEGVEELGIDKEDTGTGGRQTMGLENFLQRGGAGGSSILIGYMGDEPPLEESPGEFLALGRQADYRESAKATGG